MTSWPTPLRFLERLFSFVAFTSQTARATAQLSPADSWATSTTPPPPESTNGTRTVPAGTACPVPATSHGRAHAAAFFRHPDPFRDDQHNGSPDLELWPPSVVELALAMDVLDGGDDADPQELWRVCQSMPRLHAVKEAARQVRAADAMLARIK